MTFCHLWLVNGQQLEVDAQISGQKTLHPLCYSPTSHLNRNPPQESLPQSHSGASQIHHICSHIQSIASLQHCGDTIYKKKKKDRVKCKIKTNMINIVHSLKKRKRWCSYVPLCFPSGSSYFTPTQWPDLKSVVPAINMTILFFHSLLLSFAQS